MLFSFLILSCSTKKYAQEMLPDGKTWMVKVYRVSSEPEMKEQVTKRGHLICGAEPFRVISCDQKRRGVNWSDVHCLIKCGEKPVLAKEKVNASQPDKTLEFDPNLKNEIQKSQ